jgi:hypothetical protein
MVTILGEKICVFLKKECYDQCFALFRFVLSKKRQFLSHFLCENIHKILTTVPEDS